MSKNAGLAVVMLLLACGCGASSTGNPDSTHAADTSSATDLLADSSGDESTPDAADVAGAVDAGDESTPDESDGAGAVDAGDSAAIADTQAAITCGPGTKEKDGQCLPAFLADGVTEETIAQHLAFALTEACGLCGCPSACVAYGQNFGGLVTLQFFEKTKAEMIAAGEVPQFDTAALGAFVEMWKVTSDQCADFPSAKVSTALLQMLLQAGSSPLTANRTDGQSCATDFSCAVGHFCSPSDKCEKKKALNELCLNFWQCQSGLTCTGGKCATQHADGQSCSLDQQCLKLSCVLGKCGPRLPAGIACTKDNDCRSEKCDTTCVAVTYCETIKEMSEDAGAPVIPP